MYIKIEDHSPVSGQPVRVIDYPGTILQFVKIHFLFFGFYRVEKAGTNKYMIYYKLDGQHVYTVSKAKKEDIQK